jgi:hypothetical protein
MAASASSSQPDASPTPALDTWAPLRFFLGTWEGTGSGRWGSSAVKREYEMVLDDSFVFYRNESVYAPQEKNAEGERHEDWGLYSFDKARKAFVLRQFHNEAIVNRFVSDNPINDRTIVFTSEHIENFVPGWRARETYRILGEDEFEEVFELGPPDGEFKVFLTNRFRRVG